MGEQLQSCAKITRPTVDGMLFRERLFRRLDEPEKATVAWISGPAGSGKTTLVSSYLEARGLSHLWYQVDSGDADLASFFYFLGLAVKKTASRRREPMPLLTPEYLQGIPEFSRNFFTELFSRLQRPAVLVFDNTQEVPGECPLFDAIIAGLIRMPVDIRIMLVSRNEPPPQFTRLRANRIMNMLDWHDLRLTIEEFIEIAGQWNVTEERSETFSRLHTQVDGWAAGLKLILEGASELGGTLALTGEEAPREIFDYFAAEVFGQVEATIQDCLLKTSFLPRIQVPLAEKLTKNKRTGQILKDLYHRNFFIVKHARLQPIYEYHPLFREFLLTMAHRRFSSADLDCIKKDAAKLLEGAGQITEAITLLQQTNDLANLTRLLMEQAPLLLAQGRHQTVERWLAELPEEVLVNTPWLLFWLGSARMSSDPSAGRPLFAQALELFDDHGDETGAFLSWSGVVDAIVYTFDSFMLLDEWLQRFDRLVERYPSFPSQEIEVRVITSLLHIFALRQPCHGDFDMWENRGLSVASAVNDIDLRINICMPMIMAAIFAGDLVKAEKMLMGLKDSIRTADHCSLAVISLKVMEVSYFWSAGRFEECECALDKGLELAEASGIKPTVFPIMCHGTAGLLSNGNLNKAKEYIDKMSALQDRVGRCEKGFYHIMKAWENLLERKPPLALHHAEKSLQILLLVGMPQTTVLAHLAMGLGLHEVGEHESAAEHIVKAREYSKQIKTHQVEFACCLAEASLAYDCNYNKLGERSLATALSLGKKHEYYNCYFWRAETIARLCCKALEDGIEKEYVRCLIRQRNLMPEIPPIELEDWPWPVRIYTLGRFELVRDDKPIRFSGKAQQKPLDLLKALIALGGRKVSEFRLAEVLWPESDGDMQHQSLATTLHRLRRIVGIKDFIQYTNGHLSLDTRYCWVDAWAFERLLTQAENEAGEGKKESILSAVRMTKKALSLYKGDFLPQANREHWCILKKEHLKNRFLKGVIFLGRKLEKIGKQDEAVLHYQNALDIEPLAEEFYQRLMIYYHGKGQYADAALLYQRCRENLETFLHVQPSKQTSSLYKSLLSESGNIDTE